MVIYKCDFCNKEVAGHETPGAISKPAGWYEHYDEVLEKWFFVCSEDCVKAIKYKLLLMKILKIFRKEFPRENDEELIEEFGDLGQPRTILREIEKLLEEGKP